MLNLLILQIKRHNPYFNRWFSAISLMLQLGFQMMIVTILILIDGFLQYSSNCLKVAYTYVTILILIDGFLQLELHTIS